MKEGVSKNIYGWIFIEAGLQEFYRATGNGENLENDVQREGIPTIRKDNFHPARYMMLNILSLDRMIKNEGKLSTFR
ncbi:MAG: hypothetical protein Q8O92_15880 [Candidatus Latescibacter sp.]|nr:hypothetical protein [Candidatus Latescibacter sp.]